MPLARHDRRIFTPTPHESSSRRRGYRRRLAAGLGHVAAKIRPAVSGQLTSGPVRMGMGCGLRWGRRAERGPRRLRHPRPWRSRSALAEIGNPHLDDPGPIDPGDADMFEDPGVERCTALYRATTVMLYRGAHNRLPALPTEPVANTANWTLLPFRPERVYGVSRL